MIRFCQNQRLESLRRKRNQFHLKALLRQRYQGNHRQIFRRVTRLQNLNLSKDFTMMPISLEMRMIQFFENFLSAFLMVVMVNGQASAIKVIQLQQNIDTCSGMPNTERLRHIIKTIGILTQMISW